MCKRTGFSAQLATTEKIPIYRPIQPFLGYRIIYTYSNWPILGREESCQFDNILNIVLPDYPTHPVFESAGGIHLPGSLKAPGVIDNKEQEPALIELVLMLPDYLPFVISMPTICRSVTVTTSLFPSYRIRMCELHQ